MRIEPSVDFISPILVPYFLSLLRMSAVVWIDDRDALVKWKI